MALAAASTRDRRDTGDIFEPGVAANAIIFQGGLVCYNNAGFLVPAADTAGFGTCIGVAQEDADNTGGANGDIRCRVISAIFVFTDSAAPAAIAVTDRNTYCYATDDDNVQLGGTGDMPIAGLIEDVTAAGVWVRVSAANAAAAIDTAVGVGGEPFKVRGASTANIAALATFTVAGVDGLTYVETERILLKDQAAPAENGIYVVGVVAVGVAPLTRALDADGNDEVVAGMMVVVAEGTAGLDTAWHLDTNDPITVDTTGLVFTQRLFGFGIAGAMANQTIAAANAGTQATAARVDHNHQFPTGNGAQIDAAATAAGAGAAATFAASDHAHGIVAPGVPTNITTAIAAAAAGAATTFADSAHVHGMTAPGVPTNITTAIAAAAAGAVGTFADSGHVHGMTAPGAPVGSAIGDAQVDGAAGTFADSDHQHAREAAAAPLDTGELNAIGAGATVAYSDHVHAEHSHEVRYVMTTDVPNLAAFVFTQDGIAGNLNDLVLLANQTVAAENGVYELTAVAATATLERADWMPVDAVLDDGYTVHVGEGTLFANTTWFIDTNGAITIATTAHTWYPECVTQTAVLAAGTLTIATVPIFSVTRTGFVLTRRIANTSALTVGGYCVSVGGANGVTAGPVGTAAVIIEACVGAGTINNADISTLNFTILNR